MTSVVFVAGPAGSGKSTLGDALAASLDGVHLDFDVVSAGVVDAARAAHPGSSEAELLLQVKDDRYAALHAALADRLATVPDAPVVVSAPFTRQVAEASTWQPWADLAPGALVVWLRLDEGERARRIAARGAVRDRGAAPGPTTAPGVPHLALEAADPTPALVASVRRALGLTADKG